MMGNYVKLQNIKDIKAQLEDEFDTYYTDFDRHTEPLLSELKKELSVQNCKTSYEKKNVLHELLCKKAPIHIFKNFPLFFEFSSGRTRHDWGGLTSPVACYFMDSTADKWINIYKADIEQDMKNGLIHGWMPVGRDHHVPGYDKLLRLGVNGIIAEADEKLSACDDEKKSAFYRSVIRGNKALIALAQRFSDEAKALIPKAETDDERKNYELIADAASKVPANPPETFYEALCSIVFYREAVGSIEGIGMSSFAHLDRMLYPYYNNDIKCGRITKEFALELFCKLLIYTDVRFESHIGKYYETSTTIELGGCDKDGNIIYNELTELILDAVLNVRSVATKINCRISKAHPKAFIEKIAQIQLEDLPTVMVHNDDVLIPARVKYGQDIKDARNYVGCGCHEITLGGTEVCTRADTWINVPALFMKTLRENADCGSFDELYDTFISDVKAYHDKIAEFKNKGEKYWCDYEPYPVYSSSIAGCIEKGLDVTEGGAKYNNTMLSMTGAATVIDSLYSVKKLVYDEKRVTINELISVLDGNFETNPDLRQYILKKIPKHGTNSDEINDFSARVLHDLSTVSEQDNARGGKYLPAFYPHSIFIDLGIKTGATPDGRLAGKPLSRGVSANEFIHTDSVLDIFGSIRHIDFTDYCDSFCTEITLPNMKNDENGVKIITAVIEGFLQAEGSSMQINLINRDTLVKAQNDPESYRNLYVRVCGYSANFISLDKNVQNEVLERTVR